MLASERPDTVEQWRGTLGGAAESLQSSDSTLVEIAIAPEAVESSGAETLGGAAASLQSSDSTSVEIAIAPEAVDPAVPGHECVVDPALPLDECVICFAELDSAERRRLSVAVFHALALVNGLPRTADAPSAAMWSTRKFSPRRRATARTSSAG